AHLFALPVVSASHSFFSFRSPPTTYLYPLSLHDALPISGRPRNPRRRLCRPGPASRPANSLFLLPTRPPDRSVRCPRSCRRVGRDRKSTRLNSSHVSISYAVFCLKKKKKK